VVPVDKTTKFFKSQDTPQKWHLVDADGKTLGRLATHVARLLRGKHKPQFTPNADLGDFVVVVNASKIKVTGKRTELKEYFHYTGYPGGATFEKFQDLLQKHPERVFEHAVKGMLPHNRLGRQIIKKMKVYAGPEHPHKAQQPEALTV
jgi:large subunit ribosomal protein L13